MNIFHKVVLQDLKKNRTRTLVTVIGVVLSAALFTTVPLLGHLFYNIWSMAQSLNAAVGILIS